MVGIIRYPCGPYSPLVVGLGPTLTLILILICVVHRVFVTCSLIFYKFAFILYSTQKDFEVHVVPSPFPVMNLGPTLTLTLICVVHKIPITFSLVFNEFAGFLYSTLGFWFSPQWGYLLGFIIVGITRYLCGPYSPSVNNLGLTLTLILICMVQRIFVTCSLIFNKFACFLYSTQTIG